MLLWEWLIKINGSSDFLCPVVLLEWLQKFWIRTLIKYENCSTACVKITVRSSTWPCTLALPVCWLLHLCLVFSWGVSRSCQQYSEKSKIKEHICTPYYWILQRTSADDTFLIIKWHNVCLSTDTLYPFWAMFTVDSLDRYIHQQSADISMGSGLIGQATVCQW